MPTFLQQVAAVQSATGLSARRLCRRAGLSRATYCRWHHRHRCGQSLLRTPGPPKTGPLPLAAVRQQIAQLPHGRHRTRGTGALYQLYRDRLSRRRLDQLVQAERQRQQQLQRDHLQHVTWFSVHTAWALDATAWQTGQPGVKLQVLAARDLASHYGLGLEAQPELHGDWVADYLDQLIHRHGAPLFLKRDNGAVLHTPAVDQVLATAGVLPLDSPVLCPRYNGAIEKGIGDFKRLFPYPLPVLRSFSEGGFPFPLPGLATGNLPSTQALLEALRHEFNAKPSPALADCSPAEMFYLGPRLRVDRRTRAAIFQSLCDQTWRKLSDMKTPDQRGFAAAWRLSVVYWLRGQALISVSTNQQNQQTKQLLLPLFSQKWPH